VFEFWTGEYSRLEPHQDGIRFRSEVVPTGSARIFSLRPVNHKCCYVGSNLHFTMGREVSKWSEGEGELTIRFSLPRVVEDWGYIWLRIPHSVKAGNSATEDGTDESSNLVVHGSAYRSNEPVLPVVKDPSYTIYKIGVRVSEPEPSHNNHSTTTIGTAPVVGRTPCQIYSSILVLQF